jgi:hypothetical protein
MHHFNGVIAKKRGDVDCLTDEGDLSGDPLGMGEAPEHREVKTLKQRTILDMS